MSAPASLLHELYEKQAIDRFCSFLSGHPVQVGGSGGGGNAGAGSSKSKQSTSGAHARDNAPSYGSLSRSPRFGGFMHGNQDLHATKDEVNARDRQGRTVLHLVATDGGDAIESEVALDAARAKRLPLSLIPKKDAASCLEYLEPLLESPNINVNLQDRENGWTALHRAVYVGNLVAARRLLQHHDTDASIRDLEGAHIFTTLLPVR